MKTCPICNTEYEHDETIFCGVDGSELLVCESDGIGRRAMNFPFVGAVKSMLFRQRDSRLAARAAKTAAEEAEQEKLERIRFEAELIEKKRLETKDKFLEFRAKVIQLKNLVLEKVRNEGTDSLAYVDFDSMEGLEFEHFVAKLLTQRGFNAEVTKGSGDLGVDILATNYEGRFAIQVKRYDQPVSRRAVSDAVAGRDHYQCDFAMVVTNNRFTTDAKKLAGTTACRLVDRDELQGWITGSATSSIPFAKRLNIEIARLKDSGFYWGEDVVAIAIRELVGDLSKSHLIEEGARETLGADETSPDEGSYVLPSSSLLNAPKLLSPYVRRDLLSRAEIIAKAMTEIGFSGRVININPGPIVTSYEFQPDEGVYSEKLRNVSSMLRSELYNEELRVSKTIEDGILAIDVLNEKRRNIGFFESIESNQFRSHYSLGAFVLGKMTSGDTFVEDLFRLQNLLIAGATNRKRTAGADALIGSILFKARPDEVKLILIDSDRREFEIYRDLPHLVVPIINSVERAGIVLRSLDAEFSRRIDAILSFGVRSIEEFNKEISIRIASELFEKDESAYRFFPHIVIVINELSELLEANSLMAEQLETFMRVSGSLGIHFVLATLRVNRQVGDFINSIRNLPKLISFVPAPFDSRYILNERAVDSFLSADEMLFVPESNVHVHLNEAQLENDEISRVVQHVKAQAQPEYIKAGTNSDLHLAYDSDLPGRRDPLFMDALKCVVQAKRGSTSLLQRHLRIGYGRAAAILDAMVREGYIGEMDGSTRARPVLQKAYDDLQDVVEMLNEE